MTIHEYRQWEKRNRRYRAEAEVSAARIAMAEAEREAHKVISRTGQYGGEVADRLESARDKVITSRAILDYALSGVWGMYPN